MEGAGATPGGPPINTGIVSVTIESLGQTTINGLTQASFDSVNEIQIETGRGADTVVLAGPTSTTISVDTGRGDDYVEIERGPEGRSPKPLTINAGRGADHILIRQLSDQATVMSIETGQGNDRVTFTDSEIMREPGLIDMGPGDDVLVGSDDRTNVDISRGLILGGDGVDTVINPLYFLQEDATAGPAYAGFEETVVGSFIGGDVTTTIEFDPEIGNVLTIDGRDSFDHDIRLTSTGEGQVSVESLGFGASIVGETDFTGIDRVKVVLGSGRDRVFADNLWLSDNLIINTGLGDDSVTVSGGQLERLRVDTGGGDDEVLLDGITVNRRAKVVTGWGVDHLTIQDSLFKRKAIFEGGLDDDTLQILASQFDRGLNEDFEL